MSYSWEPKWIRRKIKLAESIEIETCYDEATTLFLCPLCIDITKVCPSYTDYSNIIPEKSLYFFSIEDLMHHMRTHGREGDVSKLYIVQTESEEMEEEEAEEE
ncbi:hypothetical protein QPL79_00090 [Ignisphaera sp. 4213-co]|uniref:Uncharacterized protein n=1 Tax=Ignisphaera cupida TaxID=3050454 RepID=A0ABD4Z3R3_9CREN|nr:hypothetical protein [Ignisphaera sp. 4213-co]MDK6027774.1 hypothetical protein [Ignisphaera sp. 4213-co]